MQYAQKKNYTPKGLLSTIGLSCCFIFLFACNKNTPSKDSSNTIAQEPQNTVEAFSRTAVGWHMLTNNHNGSTLKWDLDLMEDSTWNGTMIMPDSTYAVPRMIFDDESLNGVVITSLVDGDLSVNASIGDGIISFKLTNFNQIDQTSFSFNSESETELLTTFTITTNESSVDEFKTMLLGSWPMDGSEGKSGEAQKTTWIIPVAKMIIRAVVVVTVIVMDHCSLAIQQARERCNTPPCDFIAGLCSGECVKCSD